MEHPTSDEEMDAVSATTRPNPWPLRVCILIGVVVGIAPHNPFVKAKLKQADAWSTCLVHMGKLAPVSESAPFGVAIHGVQCAFKRVDNFISFQEDMTKRYPEAPMALGSLLRN
jgi:hypothetical protein